MPDRLELPCWGCIHPTAPDARVWLANCSDQDFENQRSPSGLPLSCCRVRVVGVVPASNTTRAASAGACTHTTRTLAECPLLGQSGQAGDGRNDATDLRGPAPGRSE